MAQPPHAPTAWSWRRTPAIRLLDSWLHILDVSSYPSSIHFPLSSQCYPASQTDHLTFSHAVTNYIQVPARLQDFPSSTPHPQNSVLSPLPPSPCRNPALRNAADQEPQARMIQASTLLVRKPKPRCRICSSSETLEHPRTFQEHLSSY